jgi:REP element-mobilizing transposase RayT
MPRRLRVDFPGAIHHVMNRGVARQPTFFSDTDRIEFGVQLAEIHHRFGAEVLAYCLMSNHYHLLLRTPEGTLAQAMKHLGQTYTRHANDRLGRDGPLFRGRYHSIVVQTDPYLLWAARYIHRNPLDVAGVATPSDYRWSSYRAYLGLRRPPAFLCTEVVLAPFGDDRGALARFTESDDTVGLLDASAPVVELLQRVELAIAADDLTSGDDARGVTSRSALVLLAERLPPGPLRARLLEHLAFPSTGARYAAVRRVTQGRDDGVERVVANVLASLGVRSTIGV